MDYLLAQSLSLIFYIITLVVYSRARKEYVGGKIAAAIKLIMIFMVILFLADFVDYFFVLFLPLNPDMILIFKILLKLIAICTLFFGGLKFFLSRPADAVRVHQNDHLQEIGIEPMEPAVGSVENDAVSTIVLEEVPHALPTLGRYEILGQISRGAMGIVYKGRDPKLNRLTAIKTIRFSDEFDEDQVETAQKQFNREAEVVAKLAPPHIVTLYAMGEAFDLSYIAMEYLEGESLEKYTKVGNLLPVKQCVEVVKQVCDALEYAHSRGIVHRDIKPANMMLLKDGLVKVTDFGIARLTASSRTHTGIIKGTPYYMSPEQAKGMKVGGPSDIFSLGVVFYQLLTGRLPFAGANMASIMYQITTEDHRPPTDYNPKISRAAVSIINRALEKNLNTRYQSAEQMGNDLQLLIQVLEADQELQGKEDIAFEDMDRYPETVEIFDTPMPGSELGEENDLDFSDLDHILEIEKEDEIEPQASAEATDPAPEAQYDQGDELDFSDLEQMLYPDSDFEREKDLEFGGIDLVSTIDEAPGFDASEIDRQKDDDSDTSDLAQLTEADKIEEVADETLQAKPLTVTYVETLSDDKAEEDAISPLATEVKASLADWKRLLFDKEARPIAMTKFIRLLAIAGFLTCLLLVFYYHLSSKSTRQDDQLAQQLRRFYVERQEQQKTKNEKSSVQQIEIKHKQTEPEPPAIVENQKQAARKRLADIEAKKQAERKRLAKIKKEKQAERERLAKIEKEKRAERERRVRIEKDRLEALKREELHNLGKTISQAKNALTHKKYLEAKNSYDAAFKFIKASDFKDDELFAAYKREIKNALERDEIVYGAKGYIQYKNKWMSPDDYEKNLYGEGYVKYKGKFKYYTGLKNIIEHITRPSVQSFLISKYSGQNIHKKQIKFSKIALRQNSGQSAYFTVLYRWEVWTFNEIGEGECSFDLVYDVKKDAWNINRGCE